MIIDVHQCKDGIVIIENNEKATVFKGDWIIQDFQEYSVEKVKKFRRMNPKEVKVK